MLTKKSGIALFYVGIFFLFIHTTIPFLWVLVGVPLTYPLASSEGILAILPGITPAIGAILIVVGGVIYGREARM